MSPADIKAPPTPEQSTVKDALARLDRMSREFDEVRSMLSGQRTLADVVRK